MKSEALRRAAIVALMMSSGVALAQDLQITVDTKTSTATIDAGTVVDASGFLIGDYDPDTNPEGTQTRPGIFGGSGNMAIDTITTFESETVLDSMPSGSMSLSLDTPGGAGEIEGFALDLLNGADAATGLSVTIGFDTFRTLSPEFLYLGGIPITIPLGEVGRIGSATLTQSGAAAVVLAPADLPEAFEISGAIPALLDMSVTLMLPGGEPSDFPIEGLPVLVPIAGQIELLGDGSALLTLSAAPDPIVSTVPIEGVDLPAIPFELPTLGEQTAGVLFTLSPQSISIEASLELSIQATGEPAGCPADLSGDGELNFFDVSAFLSAYTAMDPVADFDGNGVFNFFDVSAFLGAYSAGCP